MFDGSVPSPPAVATPSRLPPCYSVEREFQVEQAEFKECELLLPSNVSPFDDFNVLMFDCFLHKIQRATQDGEESCPAQQITGILIQINTCAVCSSFGEP